MITKCRGIIPWMTLTNSCGYQKDLPTLQCYRDRQTLLISDYVPAVCFTMQVSHILWGVCGQVGRCAGGG